MRLNDFVQQRLAIFLCDQKTGRPLRKVPVYAEVVLLALDTSELALKCPNLERLREQVPEMAATIEKAISLHIDKTWFNAQCEELTLWIVEQLRRQHIVLDRPVSDEVRVIIEATVKAASVKFEATRPTSTGLFDGRRIPLGVLASDHAGFLSYDLSRIQWQKILPKEQMLGCGVEIYAYPLLRDDLSFQILNQNRIALDAIVGKLELPMDAEGLQPPASLNLPSLQNPSLIDWRLSPGSFAAVPQQLIGSDGCETLTPANFSISEFHMRQVVRLNERAGSSSHPKAHVYEYALSLTPIGHSLGEVKYALPLAPGETVRLAVIDWRRTDTATRSETAVVTEALLHDQTHDRMITETVRGALDEWQRGGSVMGGLAGGAGASGKSGSTSIVGGGMLSLGGAYATTSGSKDIAVDTTQKITEAIHQSSVGQRELNSTVVVQSDQMERQNIETRAFANHNRGHTLTILYYEVLRHFRVETRFIRRYDAVLLKRPAYDLRNDVFLLAKRHVLEPNLLDKRLMGGFDALERIDKVRKDRHRNPPVPQVVINEADLVFTHFVIRFLPDNADTEAVDFFITKRGGGEALFTFGGSWNANYDENFNHSGEWQTLSTDYVGIRWGEIERINWRKRSGDDEMKLHNIDIDGISVSGTRAIFRHTPGRKYRIEQIYSHEALMAIPPPPPPIPPPIPSFDQSLSLEDYAFAHKLKDHLVEESEHYWRALDLGTNNNSWARRLEEEVWATVPTITQAIDEVAPTPLEVLGSRIAFPLLTQSDENPPDIPRSERLISLPTRGVFAEAKLGHCNVAEEIDETRFWRWDEHPLPFVAPEIGAVDPNSSKSKEVNLAATSLPTPVATIQTPTALPQPSGMSEALKLLATPNIFRDMSMGKELGEFLGDLISGSVNMAEAATKAQDIKSKLDSQMDKQQRDQTVALAQNQTALEKARIEAEHAKAQRVTPAEAQHTSKVIENQLAKGNITMEEARSANRNLVANQPGTQPVASTLGAEKKIMFTLKGWGDKEIIGQWRIDLDQRGTAAGFIIETATNLQGKVIVKVPDEFKDNRYTATIAGEVLSGFGINAILTVKNLLLEFPPDKYKTQNFLYVVLKATTDKFHTKASDSDEVTKKFSEHLGVSPEVGYKNIIKVTGEGGWTWERENKKIVGREIEMDVYFYTGGFTVESYA